MPDPLENTRVEGSRKGFFKRTKGSNAYPPSCRLFFHRGSQISNTAVTTTILPLLLLLLLPPTATTTTARIALALTALRDTMRDDDCEDTDSGNSWGMVSSVLPIVAVATLRN